MVSLNPNIDLHLHFRDIADAFIQSILQRFIHTSTVESTTQGDSQLVGSSQGEASPRH